LRLNGSLQTVSIGSAHGSAMFDTSELLRIRSYCDRNRWASGMLQKMDNGDDDLLMRTKDTTVLSLNVVHWSIDFQHS
jgi:hypothetical protein